MRSVLCAAVVSLFVLPSAFAQSAPVTKPSGLVFQSLVDGKGASPAATDVVKVHYRGTFPDGKEFDSSYKRGEPTEFPLNGVIPCWTEGVQLMKVGGKAKLTCPPGIAYGTRGASRRGGKEGVGRLYQEDGQRKGSGEDRFRPDLHRNEEG